MKESIAFFIFWMVLLLSVFFSTVNAQVIPNRVNFNDPNFPSKRKFNAGVLATYTGIVPPPAIVGDVTYGVSSKIAVGVLGGTTGALALAGLKLNATLIRKNNFKVMYRMITIYYPERKGKFLFDRKDKFVMPWMLSMGAIDGEWVSKNGTRYSLGVGMLETHCIEGMKKYFWGHSDEKKVMPFEIFNTAQASVSIPVSKKLTLRPEIITVMKGTTLIKRGEFKVFPINPYLKLIYTFRTK